MAGNPRRTLVASLVALQVLLVPPAPAATTNTAEIVAKTAMALPACLDWGIVGVCIWLSCGWTGCKVVTTPKIRNYVPDAVVTARNESETHPWVELSPVTAASGGVLHGLLGGADGHGDMGPTGSAGRPREHQIYREADVVGHPLGMSGFLDLTGYSDLLPEFLGQVHLGWWDSIFAGLLGNNLICPPRTMPLFPYFQSGNDALVWRGIVPVESLYPAALIPGLREVGHFPANNWGSVYPRTGALVQYDEPKAAAVIAQRAGDIVTRENQPHAYVPLTTGMRSLGLRWFNPPPLREGDDDTGVWQMLEPKTDRSCRVFGGNDSLSISGWSDGGRKDDGGDYLFNLWRPYECCRDRGIYLGSIDW